MTETTTTETDAGTATADTTQADTGTQNNAVADTITKTETVLDSSPDNKTVNVTGDFPDSWREAIAGTDAKKLETLKRFASPKAMADSYFEAQQKIRSGLTKQITSDSTPEEVAAWREANGIPATADKYDLNLGDGYIIGENDKPQVDKFLEKMHGTNASPDQVKTALKTYFEMQNEANTQYLQKQAEIKDTAQKELRQEFGAEYDRNVNLLKGYIQNQFGDASDVLLNAVDATGTPLMNQPSVIRKFLQLALDHDPVGASLPGMGMQGLDTVTNEIKAIEKRMASDRKGYFKDESMQKRYGELLEMQTRYQKKAG